MRISIMGQRSHIAGIVANLDYRCFAVNRTENHHHTLVLLDEEFVAPLDEHCVAYDARYLWE